MKIGILGSNSFIGQTVIEILTSADEKHEIIKFSRSESNLNITKDFDFEKFIDTLESAELDVIINCVGIGRIMDFGNTKRADLESDFVVNAEFPAQVFFNINRFRSLKFALNFSSVSADLPSPLFASYSASKAYISKVIETINAENFIAKNDVIITDAHLFNFKSSRNFSGGNNESTADDISRVKKAIDAMFERKAVYYEAAFTDVLKKKVESPQEFITKSFGDKFDRMKLFSSKSKVGYLTGSFDAMHFGHINLIRRASKMCDKLIIGIHESGERKNVDFLHSLSERIENLKSLRFVTDVVITSGEDDKDWELVKYDTLFVGSDYQGTQRFKKYEITLKGKSNIVYLPRTEGVSSTQIRKKISE